MNSRNKSIAKVLNCISSGKKSSSVKGGYSLKVPIRKPNRFAKKRTKKSNKENLNVITDESSSVSNYLAKRSSVKVKPSSEFVFSPKTESKNQLEQFNRYRFQQNQSMNGGIRTLTEDSSSITNPQEMLSSRDPNINSSDFFKFKRKLHKSNL